MAITYGELKKRILLKIDEYEADADAMTSDEDIITRMPDVVNEAVRFVFYGKSHNKTWNVKQGTPINALEKKRNDPDYKPLYGEHRTEDIVYEADSACCYFFEVDDTADVFVYRYDESAGEWVSLDTETITEEDLFGHEWIDNLVFATPISVTNFPFLSNGTNWTGIAVVQDTDSYTIKYTNSGYGIYDVATAPTSVVATDWEFTSNDRTFTRIYSALENTGKYTWLSAGTTFTEANTWSFAFESNGTNFAGINVIATEIIDETTGEITGYHYDLVYSRTGEIEEDLVVWDSDNGWADEAYRVFVTEETITRADLLDRLVAEQAWRFYYANTVGDESDSTKVWDELLGWTDENYKLINAAPQSKPSVLDGVVTERTALDVWSSQGGWLDGYRTFTTQAEVPASIASFLANMSTSTQVASPIVEHKNDQPFSIYTAYKGKISDTPVPARIVFSGSYYYKYKNVCLHNVAYETEEKIPAYSGYREHEIPKNCYQIVQAYKIVDNERKNVSYYTEDNRLYLPDEEGTIFLVSKFFPDPVSADTPDDYVIDIPIDNEWIVVNKASQIFMLEGEAEEFLAEEEQGMQMLEGDIDRGRSRAPKVVRLH